jgi:hypothetical protein
MLLECRHLRHDELGFEHGDSRFLKGYVGTASFLVSSQMGNMKWKRAIPSRYDPHEPMALMNSLGPTTHAILQPGNLNFLVSPSRMRTISKNI